MCDGKLQFDLSIIKLSNWDDLICFGKMRLLHRRHDNYKVNNKSIFWHFPFPYQNSK